MAANEGLWAVWHCRAWQYCSTPGMCSTFHTNAGTAVPAVPEGGQLAHQVEAGGPGQQEAAALEVHSQAGQPRHLLACPRTQGIGCVPGEVSHQAAGEAYRCLGQQPIACMVAWGPRVVQWVHAPCKPNERNTASHKTHLPRHQAGAARHVPAGAAPPPGRPPPPGPAGSR